jgi:hypothetical protein
MCLRLEIHDPLCRSIVLEAFIHDRVQRVCCVEHPALSLLIRSAPLITEVLILQGGTSGYDMRESVRQLQQEMEQMRGLMQNCFEMQVSWGGVAIRSTVIGLYNALCFESSLRYCLRSETSFSPMQAQRLLIASRTQPGTQTGTQTGTLFTRLQSYIFIVLSRFSLSKRQLHRSRLLPRAGRALRSRPAERGRLLI